MATEAQGLFVIGEHGTRRLGMVEACPAMWVFAIHEDERGEMWFCKADGLAVWRDGKIISLARASVARCGRPYIRLLEDDAHRFWLTTDKGLVSVSRDALEALAAGGTSLPEFHVYGLPDGLRSAEFVGGNTSAGIRTPDGLMWFPSIRGIVRVDPNHIRTNTLRRPCALNRSPSMERRWPSPMGQKLPRVRSNGNFITRL